MDENTIMNEVETTEEEHFDSYEAEDSEGGISGAVLVALGAAAAGAIGAGALFAKNHGKDLLAKARAKKEAKAEEQRLKQIAAHTEALKELGMEVVLEPMVSVETEAVED